MKCAGLFLCFYALLLLNGYAVALAQPIDSTRVSDGRTELQIEKQMVEVEKKEASTNQNIKIATRPVYENPNHGKAMPIIAPTEQKVD